MNSRYEMRFTGSGGQGVILASVILAEAALLSDINAVQSQAYGPEARGGMCKAEAVMSRETIWFPKVIRPSFLLALTQPALNRYAEDLTEGAVVMVDESLEIPACLDPQQVLRLPILRTARETVGKAMTANIVAVGAINAALNLFTEDALREAVRRHIPAGTDTLNMKALEAGKALVSQAEVKKFSRSIA